MNFGEAIRAMKDGKMVRRAGWNGKGMHIYLEDAFSFPIRAGVYRGQERQYAPVIVMYTAQGVHQPGWLASQADMLADDWNMVDE